MLKHFLIGLITISCFSAAYTQKAAWDTQLSPRIANYDIEVKLDTAKKILKGKQRLTWFNDSPDVITELRFHLYMNAYKNSQSTFMSGNRFRQPPDDALGWGWTDITKMTDEYDNDLTDNIEFIQPTDGNEYDQTVARVPLAKPIKPGATAEFDMKFTTKLPRIIARTGFEGEHYYFVVQWFPKIGVYEEKGERGAEEGRWNCHQFIPTTEFYADFGVYNVEITVPKGYVVGASGVRTDESKSADDTEKIITYRAEDVIDFAWTASPDFEVVEDRWNDVSIRLLIQPEHKGNADKYIQSIKYSFEYMDKHVGEYPYTTFTIVDPPIYGVGSSGMEYPTLITGLPAFTIHEGVRQVEMVTIHEFVHQYFMQMVATNEQEEVWMDEGFTTYFENRIADRYYGEKSSEVSVGGYQRGDGEVSRLNYTGMSNPRVAPCATPGWEFNVGGERNIMYHKTGVWLKTLERMVGLSTMDNIIKTYFERWKFKHPTGQDFIDVANEVVTREHGDAFGENLDWFFDQVIYGTQVCDYKVLSINNKKQSEPIGIFENNKGKKRWRDRRAEEDDDEEATYRSRILLERVGDMIAPVEVLVQFEGGDEIREQWNGKSRNHELIYERPEKVVSVHIDPEQIMYMDINLNNNSMTTEPDELPIWKWASKVLFWMQNALQSMFFFF